MSKILSFLTISCLLIIAGCTSGKKAFEKGNYYQSTLQAIERLRKNPNHKKSRMVLEKSYPLAVKYYLDQNNNIRRTNDPFKNGKVVANYTTLNQLYEQIQRCPGALSVIPQPRKFYDEVRSYSQLAAEERYNAGMQEMKTGTREAAKDAFFNFQQADQYSPGYKDVANMMDQAHEAATLKVLVDQIPVPTVQYGLSVEFFQDQVEQFLSNNQFNEFIRFVPAGQENDDFNPNQIMVIRFDEFSVGNTNNYQNTTQLTKDSVAVGKIKMDDGSERDVMGTVKARYTEYRREIVSKGLVTMRIVDAGNNQVLLHQKFPGEYDWKTYWASFNGDERALSHQQLARTKSKPVDPPAPQELFIEFCKPIYSQLTSTIQSFYNRY